MAANAQGTNPIASVTFKFSGVIRVEQSGPVGGMQVGDQFEGSFTFDPSVSGVPYNPPQNTLDLRYPALTQWSVTIPARQLTFSGREGDIAVGNDASGWFLSDRYIVTMFPDTNTAPAPILSGHRFRFFQIDLLDFGDNSPADLLTKISLPLQPPDLARIPDYDQIGRFAFHDASLQILTITLTLADPDDEKWQSGFILPPGVDGEVNTMVATGTQLYVGGRFEKAGGLVVNNVARWDGSQWHPLGSGVHGVVYALAVDGSSVYVGGKFDSAGNLPAENLARWNGVQWEPFADVSGFDAVSFAGPNFGVQGPKVTVLLATNGQLFAGGNFRSVSGGFSGGIAVTNIARWDGTNWWALGEGVASRGGHIRALAWFQDSLYAGGIFLNAGEISATNIASWNGKYWQPVGSGLRGAEFTGWVPDVRFSGAVHALAVTTEGLCVGGTFTHAGNRRMQNLAVWNGQRWRRLAAKILSSTAEGGVYAIAGNGDHLYISGDFQRVGSRPVSNIAYRENRSWKALGAGLNSPAGSLAIVDDQVSAGGFFGMAGETGAAFIATWDGEAWSSLGEGVGNTIIGFPLTITASSNAIVVGGSIHTAGPNRVSNVAAWEGSNWAPVGRGLRDGSVNSSAWVGDKYYAAGRFTLPNGRRAVVAEWNGSDWRAIAMKVANPLSPFANVFAVTEHDGILYAAGDFSRIDGTAVTNVAMWNGKRWVQVGTNPPVPAPSRSSQQFVSNGGRLFMIGRDGDSFGRSAVYNWNGGEWTSLGLVDGAGFMQSLTSFRGELYAGGRFASLGGSPVKDIARWNGTSWVSLGDVFDETGSLLAMAATDGYLYIAGSFTNVAGIPVANIARFDGTNWASCGSGLINAEGRAWIDALTASAGKVYAGGDFKSAGHKPSYHFAIWNE